MSRMRAAALDAFSDLGPRKFLQPQAEGHVLENRHVRVERVVLKNHRDIAILRRHVVDELIADVDFARGRLLQPGDHAQGRALAAPRRPDQHDELAIGDVEIDPANRGGLVEGLDDVAERDLRHLIPFRGTRSLAEPVDAPRLL